MVEKKFRFRSRNRTCRHNRHSDNHNLYKCGHSSDPRCPSRQGCDGLRSNSCHLVLASAIADAIRSAAKSQTSADRIISAIAEATGKMARIRFRQYCLKWLYSNPGSGRLCELGGYPVDCCVGRFDSCS
ncbi:hypothetical protein TNCT_699831 [Trichonephila clavata]|uniref:Uncharacterized protein n=1 Tax=Trichonephila clavata TaxID=2740835 RepID=A0A8X6G5H9_TRICU|nr:hypothetical protein TNCT_699831 [Trichonephila clavata]